MPTKNERKFAFFQRGEIRDLVLLASWRNSLRVRVNPDTGQTFTEDEIAYATAPDSRFYFESDAIDLYGQVEQARGLHLVAQVRPRWASSEFLRQVHGPMWLGEDAPLAAVGGSGTVDAPATAGTIFVGSTTLGDPTAAVATDPNGKRFQVLETVVTPSGGVADLTLRGVDTGSVTNIVKDTVLRWSANKPLGAQPECTVTSDPRFTGGFDQETDADWGIRIEEQIRHRQGAGNNAQFNAWAQVSTVAIETAFVYASALYAGSTLVCILQKRSTDPTVYEGPLVRVQAAPGTYVDAKNYLVPPNSPVVPERAFVVVTRANSQPSNVVLQVALSFGVPGGWADAVPWPNPPEGSVLPECLVSTVNSQTDFEFIADSDLPGTSPMVGNDAPELMIWNDDLSTFERLNVQQVSEAGTIKSVLLNTAPSKTIEPNDRICPYTDRLDVLGRACESYFDTLGPGEVVDLDTDPRAHRAWRYPPPSQSYPYRAGQAIITHVFDLLGGVVTNAELVLMSKTTPDLPGQIIDGPNQLTLGHLSVFPL